ncbi:hypothetical protein [Roseovarius sp.]
MTDKITDQPEVDPEDLHFVMSHSEAVARELTRLRALVNERDALRAKLEAAVGAMTPSGDTKAAYMGKFSFPITLYHPKLGEETRRVSVPWTCIKEIMAMIHARASRAKIKGEADDTR